jgi:hypothetical protein
VESAWSTGFFHVVITEAAEVVYRPAVPYGSATGYIGDSQTYEMSHSISTSLGHGVEYRIDWDDGSFSDWSSGLAVTITDP